MVTNEFFEQGDIERRNFNITPIVSNIYSVFIFYVYTLFLNIRIMLYWCNLNTYIKYSILSFCYLYNNTNYNLLLGHYESRKRRSTTNDAGWIHRLDLFTDISG